MIQTERLTLRRPVEADRAPYMAFYSGDRRARTGVLQDAKTASAGFDKVLAHWQGQGYGRFIVECEGAVIGLIGPHQPEGYPEGELAWHIWSDAHEGQGLAHEAALAARAHAYGALGWRTAVSYIADDNPRSQALAKRLRAVVDPAAETLQVPAPHAVYRHPAPSSSEAVGRSNKPSSSEAVGRSSKPSSSEAVGRSSKPSSSEAVGRSSKPSSSEAVGQQS